MAGITSRRRALRGVTGLWLLSSSRCDRPSAASARASSPLPIPRKGRSITPRPNGTHDRMPQSPSAPAPRKRRMSTVSAWSSRWCAARTASMPSASISRAKMARRLSRARASTPGASMPPVSPASSTCKDTFSDAHSARTKRSSSSEASPRSPCCTWLASSRKPASARRRHSACSSATLSLPPLTAHSRPASSRKRPASSSARRAAATGASKLMRALLPRHKLRHLPRQRFRRAARRFSPPLRRLARG